MKRLLTSKAGAIGYGIAGLLFLVAAWFSWLSKETSVSAMWVAIAMMFFTMGWWNYAVVRLSK
jgi:hypothetical protein